MKIRKFNESNNFNWSIEKFDELGKIQKELKNLYPPLLEYLRLCDENEFANLTVDLISAIYFDDDDDEYVTLIISHGKHGFSLTRDEFKDFLLFMKDPNLYKNTKKYNL